MERLGVQGSLGSTYLARIRSRIIYISVHWCPSGISRDNVSAQLTRRLGRHAWQWVRLRRPPRGTIPALDRESISGPSRTLPW
jgi:hypothetical protein